MSSNPAQYTTEQRVNFERYAKALRDAGAGHGPFPGAPPKGYRECFIRFNAFAPVPEDYPHLLGAPQPPKDTQPTTSADVTMSAVALGTILQSHTQLAKEMLAYGGRDRRAVTFRRSNYRGRVSGRGRGGPRNLVGEHDAVSTVAKVVEPLLDFLTDRVNPRAGRKSHRSSKKKSPAADTGDGTDAGDGEEWDELMDDTTGETIEEGELDPEVDAMLDAE